MKKIQPVKINRYSGITNIADLEKIEDELLVRSDEQLDDENKEDLISLYRWMWELQPDEKRYEHTITKLLLELGWDMKRTRVNYEKARSFFEELLEVKRPARVPIANYRLGFIHYYNHKWQDAITHFQKALGGMMPNRFNHTETWARLEESQLIKANARLAMAYKHRSIEVAKRASSKYNKLEEIDETSTPYIEELHIEILAHEMKSHLCIEPNRPSRYMNDRELQELKRSEGAVVLNCTIPNREELIVSGAAYRIKGRNLEIIRKLIESNRPIPQQKLEFELTLPQSSVYILRLRDFLVSCELEREDIVAHNGYQWARPKTYLVKSRYDVADMF